MEGEVKSLNAKEEDKSIDDFSFKLADQLILGAGDFILLVSTEEFVTLVDTEDFLLVIKEEEEEVKLLHVNEDKLILFKVSQCAPLQSIGAVG